MPKRTAVQKRAREIQQAEGIGYHDALNRARAEAAAAEPATEAPAPAPAAAAYILEPTAAEAELGITAEELGVRALPADAGPARRARAEAVWRPVEAEQPCRCSGVHCHHGAPCETEYADGTCPGRVQHVDRHPGSMFDLTAWYDVYLCTGCDEPYEMTVKLPEIPWGEVRSRAELDGAERHLSSGSGSPTVTVIYDGTRHPNFPDHEPGDADEEELDPDTYPTPEDDYSGYGEEARQW
ncbi:hypothetical protein [Streptomyces hydrogenans]|uniref:hypothetical protein n=1 Tax=Streptomyces hydrogenans TaxID=1873719 RepID=UPI003332AAF3